MKKQKGNLFVRDTVGDKIILTINFIALCLFLIIIACVIEHHLIEIQTNPFLLLVLACDSGRRDDFRISHPGTEA